MRCGIYRAIVVIAVLLFTPVCGWSMIASNTSGMTLVNEEIGGIRFFLGTSIDRENGDMTYSIQGPESGGWKSELEWPLESIMYIGETVSIGYDQFQVALGFWKAVTDEAGDMKDSDWWYQYYGTDPFIYSESEATVDALHFDLNLRYDFLQSEHIALGALLGFSYTKWDWEAGNGFQESVDPDYNVGFIEGIGITYEEKVYVPYAGIALSLSPLESSSFGFNLYGVYSPIARCEDEDDHILRYKLNTGETEGTFLSLGGDVRWQFSGSWALIGKLNYTSYDLEGEQYQYFYGRNPRNPDAPAVGTWYSDIDLTIEGSQMYMGLMLGYEF